MITGEEAEKWRMDSHAMLAGHRVRIIPLTDGGRHHTVGTVLMSNDHILAVDSEDGPVRFFAWPSIHYAEVIDAEKTQVDE